MTSLKLTSALAASFLLIASGAASATEASSTTPQGWGAPAKTVPQTEKTQKTAAATTAKPRTAESIECSKQADAKGLHGKERKAFRASCKSAIKAGKPVPEPKKT